MRLLILPCLFGLLTCSTPTHSHRLSSFLGDTSELRLQHDDHGVLYYEKDGARWLEYEQLLIDEPLVVPLADDDTSVLRSPDAVAFATYFRERLVEAVVDRYTVVSSPGPDVLRVRTAITNVMPVHTIGYAAENEGEGVAMNVGGASIEAEMIDSMTGTRLAAFADTTQHRRFGSMNVLSTWNDAAEAFDDWALRFRSWLDRTHGRSVPKVRGE